MKIVELEKVANFINGYAFKPTDWCSDGLKIIRIQNLTNCNKSYNRTVKKVPAKYLIKKGDILVSWSATLDVFEWKDPEEALLNQHIFKVEHDHKIIDKSYFKYTLRYSIEKMSQFTHGSTMKHIVRKDFLKHSIPLPSLENQKRIVKILDEADALRQKRKQAITLLDDYLKSVFLEMFGDPMLNPKKIKKAKIKDIGQVFTGNTPPRNEAKNYGSFIEWIKSDNINNSGHYLTKASEFLSESGSKKARIVPSGSILVTCIAGSISCIGNAGIADREVAFNQQINAIVPNSDVDQRFLYSQILFNKELFQKASTNSMKGMLNKSKFSEIELLKPDFILQKKYADFFLKTESIKQKMLIQSQELEMGFQALMQKAFKGEL